MLKLQNLYIEVSTRVEAHKEQIIALGKQCKEKKKHYNNFETFFSAVIRDALYRPATICDWYDDYCCNDKHIIALFKAVLTDAGIFEAIG